MANILVVDDDCDTTELLGEILRGCGHQVRTANSGEAGLQALTEASFPDVIMLDDDMRPGMSGPAMVQEMYARDGGQELIPVILMSGSGTLLAVAKQAGTPYSLAKPSNVDAMLEVLNRALADQRVGSSATH